MKQMDGHSMGGQLFVILSDIYMVIMQYYFVPPLKPIFYQRFLDYIHSRPKLGDKLLSDRLSNCQATINLL